MGFRGLGVGLGVWGLGSWVFWVWGVWVWGVCKVLRLATLLDTYSGSPKVGNPIASILKGDV